MNIIQNYSGDLIYGSVVYPVIPGKFRHEGELEFYFEIDSKLMTANEYSEGLLTLGGNIVAEFGYKKPGDFIIKTRYYDNLAEYAEIIQTAIKDFEHYFKISSNE